MSRGTWTPAGRKFTRQYAALDPGAKKSLGRCKRALSLPSLNLSMTRRYFQRSSQIPTDFGQYPKIYSGKRTRIGWYVKKAFPKHTIDILLAFEKFVTTRGKRSAASMNFTILRKSARSACARHTC